MFHYISDYQEEKLKKITKDQILKQNYLRFIITNQTHIIWETLYGVFKIEYQN